MIKDAGQSPAMGSKQPVSLLTLFLIFLRIGAFSFGGGLTGWVYREVVQQRQWMSETDFLSGLALSQILPGANVTNLSVYIGQKLRGTVGALAALFALLTVPFFVVIGAATIYSRIADINWIRAATDGVAAAAIGLLLLVGWRSARYAGRDITSLAVLIATFLAVGVMRLPLVPVVLCIAPISVAAAWIRRRENGAR
jgi:chromate transporter